MTSPVHTQLALCTKKKSIIKNRETERERERTGTTRNQPHRSIDRKTKGSGQLVALFHPWTSEKDPRWRKCKRGRERKK